MTDLVEELRNKCTQGKVYCPDVYLREEWCLFCRAADELAALQESVTEQNKLLCDGFRSYRELRAENERLGKEYNELRGVLDKRNIENVEVGRYITTEPLAETVGQRQVDSFGELRSCLDPPKPKLSNDVERELAKVEHKLQLFEAQRDCAIVLLREIYATHAFIKGGLCNCELCHRVANFLKPWEAKE